MDDRHLVLWDGECGFCRRSIAWCQRHDRAGLLTFEPYQQVASPPMTPELAKACAIAVHVITTDRAVLAAGKAALFILDSIGWHRTANLLGSRCLLPLTEWGYRRVANNRQFLSRFMFTRE